MMTPFKTTFVLDKAYYQECFEQSVEAIPFHQAYFKAGVLVLLGGCLVIFTQINQYAAWFVFMLGVLEAVAQYYRKPWWVMRQMLSRAAKGEVELTIDDNAISTHSFYSEQAICWADITQVKETTFGWVIFHKQGKSYLSKQHLNDEVNNLLTQKTHQLTST
ncbi:YcxB family protein [Thalassotalea piscium]